MTALLELALLREHDNRLESWAHHETSSGGWYGDWNVMADAAVGEGVGQPKWCVPNKTWKDRRRRLRNVGASVSDTETRDGDTTVDKVDRNLSHQMEPGTEKTLLAFHVEMNGGDGNTKKGRQGWTRGYGFVLMANPGQLEVCRHCGVDLGIPRDDEDFVVRQAGPQRRYCSDRCEADADNRRDRQRRAGGKFPRSGGNWYACRPEFDLQSIAVSGVGTTAVSPRDWNRWNPRNRPDLYRPRAGNCRDVFALPAHEFVVQRRAGECHHPKVHRWQDSASRTPRHYRLALPWKQGHVWKITQLNGAVAP